MGGGWLGLTSSIKAVVKDENDKKITGGSCRYSVWSNDETTMLSSGEFQLFDGAFKSEWILKYESFAELTDYAIVLGCYCGQTGSSTECIDEDGTAVQNSIGTAKTAFTTNEWVAVREAPMQITYENGTLYPNAVAFAGYGDEISYEANVTNNYLGSTLEIVGKQYLVNNVTGAIFEESTGLNLESYSLSAGNQTIIVDFKIPNNAPTGVYYINNFINIYYNNLLVSQGIVPTETFNVTGTDDSFKLTQVLMDKNNYYTGEFLHVCANITNDYKQRVEFDILYNYRCEGNSSAFDTSRSLIGEHQEKRAVSAGTSQNQCSQLYIKYIDHLLYSTSSCYASVTIQSPYIDRFDNKISQTSSQFNITDYGMYPEYETDPTYPLIRLFPDWRRFDDVIDDVPRSYYRAKINITNINENYLDPTDLIGDADWDVYTSFSDRMPCSTNIYNYSVTLANGTAIDNPVENKAITWKKNENGEKIEGKCSLGIENVNFSDPDDDYFIAYIWYEDFEERQTKALEGLNTSWGTASDALVGIENKTGTFHLDVDCPSSATIGSDMTCNITAQVEDPQVVRKEVDFTCYITGDGNIYSSLNFNQMVNQTSITLDRDFPVPSSLEDGTQYTLQCYADYYNLGSRRDSFYDTFTTTGSSSAEAGGSYLINGRVAGDDNPERLIPEDIVDKFNPFSPDRNWVLMFVELLLLISIINIVFSFIKRKEKSSIHATSKSSVTTGRVLGIISILFVLFLFGLAIWQGASFVNGSSSENSDVGSILQVTESSQLLLQGDLTKSIFLIFIAILIISIIIIIFSAILFLLIFKLLNLRGELKFGHDSYRNSHLNKKGEKLQQKLNQIMLKNEIKKKMIKEDYKVRKMTLKEFHKFLKDKNKSKSI